MEADEAGALAWEELRRRLSAQLEAMFDGDEKALARCFMAALAPGDAQEQALAVQMALTHQLAVECIGAAREAELPEQPQWIEMGLATRFLSLHQRESAALDRHRAVKAQADERTQKQIAARRMAAAEPPPRAGFLAVPAPLSPEDWVRQAKAHHQRMAAGQPPPPEEQAARTARCERAVDSARARGENGGVVVVPDEAEPGGPVDAGPAPGDGQRGRP